MKQLLAYLGDIGYKWTDGESLYDTNTAIAIWTKRDSEELFVIIEGNEVCYEDDKDDIKKLYGEYRIMDYDNIQELKEDDSVEFFLANGNTLLMFQTYYVLTDTQNHQC